MTHTEKKHRIGFIFFMNFILLIALIGLFALAILVAVVLFIFMGVGVSLRELVAGKKKGPES